MTADPLTQLVISAVDSALERYFKAAPKKRLYTTAEAAEYLGFSEASVRNLNAMGKLVSCRVLGTRQMYDLRDLDEAIESNKEK